MLVDPDLLSRARKDHRDAVIEVMSMQYPALYRMAHALSGRADVGNGIVQFVMRRAFAAIEHWKDEAAPQRWFRHHAIITIRRATKLTPTVESDTLILPEQREAFLLKRDGLTFEQVADLTGSNKNTVKSRLRYALGKLRDGLRERGLLEARAGGEEP